MKISVPRERKNGETRVALTPAQVSALVQEGHTVFIETNAGLGSFYTDAAYSKAGAQVLNSLEETWNEADLLLKVKEPSPEEYTFFRAGLTVFSFLHPVAFPKMTELLVESGCRALSYDLLVDKQGRLPILQPMSEIAGTLSVYVGSNALLSASGGRGTLLTEVCSLPSGRIVILGAGSSGGAAARVAAALGAKTTVFDIQQAALDRIGATVPSVETFLSSERGRLQECLATADLIIGAVLVPGGIAPKILDENTFPLLRAGSAFVDISIDQGGCSISSRPSSIEQPTYVESDIVHYCVPNMPALAAQTATLALTQSIDVFVRSLLAAGRAGRLSEELESALLCDEGVLIHKKILEEFSTEQQD